MRQATAFFCLSMAVLQLTASNVRCFSAKSFPAKIDVVRGDSPTTLRMISIPGLGGSTNEKNDVSLPRDVKDAVSRCRSATQEALQKRISRMDIEFPVGTNFGVEKRKGRKSQDGAPTQDVLDASDRELARLFVEMFQPVGGDNICVVFKEQPLADDAKKKWDAAATSRVLAMNRSKKAKASQKKTKARGFAAKIALEVSDTPDGSGPFKLPDNTEVALFVAPGPKELVIIERICNEVGQGTLVILLNARLSKMKDKFGTEATAKLFEEDFEPVFCLSAAPQTAAPNCLLYRAYPNEWVLARKPKVGQPKTLLIQSNKPTFEECAAQYENMEEPGDFEKGVEGALENVAGWFR